MKNTVLLLFCCFALTFSVKGQLNEEALFGHYTVNPSLLNPAAIGFNGGSQAFMNIRSNWTGFPGAPRTYALSYNGKAGDILGLGASIFSENISLLTSLRLAGGISSRFQVTKDIKVSGGLSFEVSQRQISDATLDSEFYDTGDLIVEANIDGRRFFDVAAGFYASYKEKTYLGVSFPNMVLAKLDDISSTEDTSSTFLQSYIAQVGHKLEIKEMVLEPSIAFISINNQPWRLDVNLLAHFLDNRFTVGGSYRLSESSPVGSDSGSDLSVLVGVQVTAFKIYYSYDYSLFQFQSYNGGGHEVTVAFDFKNGGRSGKRRRRF